MTTTLNSMATLRFIRNHPLFCLILCFGVASLIFGVLVFGNSSWGDWYYSQIYVPLNAGFQELLEFSTVPFYMVVVLLGFILIIGGALGMGGHSWKTKLVKVGLFTSSTIILVVTLFYWMWGFNYGRTNLGESFFDREYVSVDPAEFKRRWALQTNRVNTLREKVVVPEDTDRLTEEYTTLYRKTAEEMPFFFDLDTRLKPRCKEFIPEGFLLRLNTAGFYFPLGSESYVDKALHVSQKPAVIAHELAHGYGITDEGEANFVGYLLSQASGDPLAQYSSALMLWLYMASDGRRLDPEFAQSEWDNLSPAVWIDLDERRKLDDRFPEFMPHMRDAIYDSYLSMNQVEGGIKSYNRFVTMVLTYEDR